MRLSIGPGTGEHAELQRKLKAATAWCERINGLPPANRDGRKWHYALLAEHVLRDWRTQQGALAELLNFARVRGSLLPEEQGKLTL
ncbi:hypothetical protein [Aromatoleum anaerobium]|uniref:Transposase n=1 Tax=Aromatoleum anaerobium TaxID=182180 RepID=A0ABX1PI83_9RHOO|nr:hypothetical protein [Aromatoleum anaerobium]MCK0507183.1 hypothetical protein [Aromatoleum anaerobium]